MAALIYVALCVPNNKLYFGITCGPLQLRIRKHLWVARNKARFRFHRALRKHGASNFVWYEIGRTPTWEDACEVERALISYFRTRSPGLGYNDTDGGEGRLGRSVSEATRRKMSEAQKGRVFSEEHLKNMRKAWVTRPPASEETRQKLRVHMLGRKMNLSDEARERIGAANRGKVRSEESIAKMRAGRARRAFSNENERG